MTSATKAGKPARGSRREAVVHLTVLAVGLLLLRPAFGPRVGWSLALVTVVVYPVWNLVTTKRWIDRTTGPSIGPDWLLPGIATVGLHAGLAAAVALVVRDLLSFRDPSTETWLAHEFVRHWRLWLMAAGVAFVAPGVMPRSWRRRWAGAIRPVHGLFQLAIAFPIGMAALGLMAILGPASGTGSLVGSPPAFTEAVTRLGWPGDLRWYLTLVGVALTLASHRGLLWQYERFVARQVTGVFAVYHEDYPKRQPGFTIFLIGLGTLTVLAGSAL